MNWVMLLLPIALELGMEVWDRIAALSEGHFPTYSELLSLNDEVQAKINSQKLS